MYLMPGDLDLLPFELKIDTLVTPDPEQVLTSVFLFFFYAWF